ncbi:hypothetical protein [Paraglaciecola sp. 2405UD69-4]|uniref:hypothetical protein n=1 Tax=Paraglaciecola sp. 2405UD69-4 TaxID=3391836 RepID=UPI0039C8CD5E
MILILAIMLGLVGSYIIYLSWKRHSKGLAISGWCCLFASLPALIVQFGLEYGSVLAVFLPALYVWLGIFQEQKKQIYPNEINKPHQAISFNFKKIVVNSWNIIYQLVLLLFVSGVITICLVDLIPIAKPEQLALGMIAMPIVWAGLSFWHLVSTNKTASLTFSLFSSLAASIYLFVV